MGTSRDANDPRDLLRAMNKEERVEFEEMELDDTGGQEHATRAEREGGPRGRRDADAAAAATERESRPRARSQKK